MKHLKGLVLFPAQLETTSARLLPQSGPICLYQATIMQQGPTLLVRQVLPIPQTLRAAGAASLPRLHVHKDCQSRADDAPGQCEDEVDGHRVVVQGPVGEGVQCGLDELAQA